MTAYKITFCDGTHIVVLTRPKVEQHKIGNKPTNDITIINI